MIVAQGDQPSTKIRIGSVTAAIWKNDKGFYSVTLQRSYKDKDGQWQNAEGFNHDDLLNAAKVLERAEDWISRK
jgi:hypothetical protein